MTDRLRELSARWDFVPSLGRNSFVCPEDKLLGKEMLAIINDIYSELYICDGGEVEGKEE